MAEFDNFESLWVNDDNLLLELEQENKANIEFHKDWPPVWDGKKTKITSNKQLQDDKDIPYIGGDIKVRSPFYKFILTTYNRYELLWSDFQDAWTMDCLTKKGKLIKSVPLFNREGKLIVKIVALPE